MRKVNPEKIKERIRLNLLRLLEENGDLNQVFLATKTGLQQAQVSRFLSGKTTPKVVDLVVLAEFFKVSLDDLVK